MTEELVMSVASLATLCIPIALWGLFWGFTDRLVVFNGKEDLLLTALGYASTIATLVASAHSSTVTFLLMGVTAIIVLISFGESRRANGSFMKACIALPTKFMLLFLILFLWMAAFGAMNEALKEHKKGNVRAAAKNAGAGAAGLLGALIVGKIIRKLVKARVSSD
ncbi:MAG: hypothetical protein PSV13_10390 [Lacunisphaera sp.]|nr:hypothetical protein [Lacunisphaera sp.]